MKIIKIDSWKNANKSALLQTVVSVLVCVVYSYIIVLLTGGEEFVGKQPTKEIINGIRFDITLVVCGILAGIVPIILLKYTKLKFMILYLPLGILYYFVILFSYVCIFDAYNIFDLIFYAITSIPIGSLVGTIIAIFINQYRNNNK